MPNWCSNYATFEHEDEEMLQQLVDAYNRGGTMQELWPCPQELRDTTAGSVGNGEEQKALEKKQQENRDKYGDAHWYDWCVNHWGTKWDFGYDHHAGRTKAKIKEKDGRKFVKLGFDTAWSPPLGFYEYLHEHYGFRVKAYYFEPGMGFAGTSKNGSENTIDIREFTEEWLEDNMPEKLCRIFNMYELAAQMAEDEEEFNERQKAHDDI